MYSWDDSLDDWARPGAYRFDSARAEARRGEAGKAKASGPRSYHDRGAPITALVDPKRRCTTKSSTPLVIAVDVTGSMRRWPFEIFDRLPLLYNTLSQYRPDLEVLFAAIGDARCDRYPLQVTEFSKGFALENQLKALYGEGGGGDEPESYGLFAHWLNTHVELARGPEKPFLIVFGDATMHADSRPDEIRDVLGDGYQTPVASKTSWREVSKTWNTWFLRRQGRRDDAVEKQWTDYLGHQQILHIEDEQRAVDYAMGLIARHWGHLDDFQRNLGARQDGQSLQRVIQGVEAAWSWCAPRRSKRASKKAS